MTLTEFQSWVEQNAKWFQGVHPETNASIAQAEQQLGHSLPPSLAWLLTKWGYSTACGVDSLADTVATTLRVRKSLGLPERYIVLNDWQDAGIVFLDAAMPKEKENGQEDESVREYPEYPVYFVGAHNFERLARNEVMDNDVDAFVGFPDWVASRLENAKAADE